MRQSRCVKTTGPRGPETTYQRPRRRMPHSPGPGGKRISGFQRRIPRSGAAILVRLLYGGPKRLVYFAPARGYGGARYFDGHDARLSPRGYIVCKMRRRTRTPRDAILTLRGICHSPPQSQCETTAQNNPPAGRHPPCRLRIASAPGVIFDNPITTDSTISCARAPRPAGASAAINRAQN